MRFVRDLFGVAFACAIALAGINAACSKAPGGGDGVAPEPDDDGSVTDIDGGDDDAGDPDIPAARCGAVQTTNASSCRVGDGGTSDAATDDAETPPPDADLGDGDDGEPSSSYGDPVDGPEGDDDLCKYHVAWSVSPDPASGTAVTFTINGVKLADASPMAGAAPRVEAFLADDETHTLDTSSAKATETTPGHYGIGPLTFDASGAWTVRFHLFDACTEDLPDSPAGHIAFLVQVK